MLDALQEFLGAGAVNFRLEATSAGTAVRVPAGSGNDQASVAISGRWRYNTATVTAGLPGTPNVGWNDVYVTASDNSFSGTPEVDSTVYTFGLVVLASGTPATALHRKVGRVYVESGVITGVEQSTGAGSSGAPSFSQASVPQLTPVNVMGAASQTAPLVSLRNSSGVSKVRMFDTGAVAMDGTLTLTPGTGAAAVTVAGGVGEGVIVGDADGAGRHLLSGRLAGDTQYRFRATVAGLLSWGVGGTTAPDTTLQRDTNGLVTSRAFDATGYRVAGTLLASTHLSDSAQLARLASPAFTGAPTAPTAAVDTNTTQIATTAYVVGQGYAKLASPALTGTPTAPTAAPGTNTTQIATTAFVAASTPTGMAYLADTQTFAGTNTFSSGNLIVDRGAGTGTAVLTLTGRSAGSAMAATISTGTTGDVTLNSVSGSNQYFQFNGTSRLTVHTTGITVNGGVTSNAAGNFATGLTVDPASGTSSVALTLTARNAGTAKTATLTTVTDGSARLAVAAGSAVFLRVNTTDRVSVDDNGVIVAGNVFASGSGSFTTALGLDPGSGTTAATLTLTGRSSGTANSVTVAASTAGQLQGRYTALAGFDIGATAPPSTVAGNGTSATLSQLLAPPGQATSGTTGQTAGAGGALTVAAGTGGTAPSGSTNGAGGNLILASGGPGAGAGTAAASGFVELYAGSALAANTLLRGYRTGGITRLGFFDTFPVGRYAAPTQAAIGSVPGALTSASTLNDVIAWVSRLANALQGYGLLGNAGAWAA